MSTITFSEEWHQYDGVMHKKPDGDFKALMKSIRSILPGQQSHYQRIIEETEAATRAMLPRWVGLSGLDLAGTG